MQTLRLNHAETVLAVAGHAVRLFDTAEGHQQLKRCTGHATPVRALVFHPSDGGFVTGAVQDRFLNLWRAGAAAAGEGAASAVAGTP